jgi:hypothetical protein
MADLEKENHSGGNAIAALRKSRRKRQRYGGHATALIPGIGISICLAIPYRQVNVSPMQRAKSLAT